MIHKSNIENQQFLRVLTINKQTESLFSDKAEDYAKYRPTYPERAIDIVMDGMIRREAFRAVDIGAGTGISSVLLAERGAEVIAVEPNPSMISLGETHPNLRYLQAPAEDIPLEDSSADLVSCFQSFQWFDVKKSLREIKRILKPGGRLCILWNYWDPNDPFTQRYMECINRAVDKNEERISPYGGIKGKIEHLRVKILWKFGYLPYFKNVQHHHLKHRQPMDKEGLIGCARSQSNIRHEGPSWEQLVREIRILAKGSEEPRLVHNINLFYCTPR